MNTLSGPYAVTATLRGLIIMFAMIACANADAPRVFAITDVRIVSSPGNRIENGTIVLRDGLIEAVGENVTAPADAKIIVGQDGWSVYPAFIDAAATIGVDNEPSNGPSGRPGGRDEKKRPGSRHELESVHPEFSIIDEIDVTHSSIEKHRELGFAVAHVLPGSGVFRGESAVILLRDAPAPTLVIADRMMQVVALETSSFMARKYPSSSIGAVATVRQTLLDAQRQLVWRERYSANPVGMRRPEYRASDAPLLAVVRGERPIVFVSRARLDPGRFNAFAEEFELKSIVVATGLGHRFEDLRAANMPVLLPLELPEKPDLDNPDEAREASLRELQAIARAPGLPGALAGEKIEFAFVTAGMKSTRAVTENLAAIVEAGLAPEQALAALTTTPARLLGLDSTLGMIEPGMQANLLVVDGELFVAKPAFRHRFIDGYEEEIEAEETIGDPNAVVDPRGRWEIRSEVMGRGSESTWTIAGSEGRYRGFSESSRAGKRQFKSVELIGNAMTVVSDTPRGEIDITVVVTGETLAGETMMESPRGSAKMEIEGRRVAGPEGNEQ